MLRLALADLVFHRQTLVTQAILMFSTMLAVGFAMGPQAANGIPIVLQLVVAWGYAERMANEDDKTEAWTFLRALPIPPRHVVGARFLSVGAVVGIFAPVVALPLAWFAPQPPPPGTLAWPAAVGAGAAAALVVGALFNTAYFRFGYRPTATWFRFALMGVFAVVTLAFAALGRNRAAGGEFLATFGPWAAAHPAVLAAAVAGLAGAVYAVGWGYAALAFSRRELT